MAFDIAKALGDISRKPEGQKQIQYIPLHLIDGNPKNNYSTNGIESLAANIQMWGLLDPLIVKETPDRRYMLISGHRRRLALRMNAEAAENYPDSMHEPVPCIVEPEDAPLPGIDDPEKAAAARPLAEELKLIYANADTRVMSSADTAQQVRKIRELLLALQDLGYKFPGKMRDHVAAAAKVSATRVARLDVIDKGLKEPALRKAWKDGTLGETSAYEIARRSPEAQHAAATFTGPDALQKMTTEQIDVVMDHYEQRAEEDRKAKEEWNRNVSTMAKATKDAEPKKSTGRDFSADEYLKQRRREDDTFAERLDELFDMFVKDLDYVTDRREGIEFLKRKHGGGHHGGTTETGFFDCSLKGLTLADDDYEDAITRTWTEVFDELSLGALRMVARGKVSAADTGSKPDWKTGAPREPGDYAVRVGFGLKEDPRGCYTKVVTWTGSYWSEGNNVPIRDGLTIFRWFKLPEV